MEKSINIIIPANASYDEVEDTIADVLTAGIIIESQLKDGFQYQDLLAVLQLNPIASEVYRDAPAFFEQFTKLNPETALAAVIGAKNRLLSQGKQLGKVTQFILNFLFVGANNYSFAIRSYQEGQRQYLLWQTLLKGGEVFPGIKEPIKNIA